MNVLKADSMPKGLPTVQLLTKYALLILARKQRHEVFKVEWMHTSYVIHDGIVFYYQQKPKKTEVKQDDRKQA